MPTYIVELRGECRELFLVEADSPEEAAANWQDGDSFIMEASSMEVYDVREDS